MENKDDKLLTVEPITTCPECGSKNLIVDPKTGFRECGDCGAVIDENPIDLGQDWRAFDNEQMEKRARTGAPMTYRIYDKGLGTLVTWSPTSQGHYKPKKWQRRTHIANTTERGFIFALTEIDRMACALKLPINIREAASMLYRKAMKERLVRGRSIEGMSTAILYITCRQYGVPRTLEEVTDVSRVGQKEISRAYRFLLRKLKLKVKTVHPADFVPRFCSLLDLGGEVREKAIEIIRRAEKQGITNGRGPIGIAAATIYIAAMLNGEHRTQKEVSDVTDVTEVTIRNRYKEIAEQLEIDVITEDFKPEIPISATEEQGLKADFVVNDTVDNPLFQCLEEISTELQLSPEMVSFAKEISEETKKQGFLRKFGIEELATGLICYTLRVYKMETTITQKQVAKIKGVNRKIVRDIKKLIIKTIEGNQSLSFFIYKIRKCDRIELYERSASV